MMLCSRQKCPFSYSSSKLHRSFWELRAVLREIKNFRNPLGLCLLMPGLEIRILWDSCMSIVNVHEQPGTIRVQSIPAAALGHYTEQLIQGRRDTELSCFLRELLMQGVWWTHRRPQKSPTVESCTTNNTLALIMALLQTCSKCLK